MASVENQFDGKKTNLDGAHHSVVIIGAGFSGLLCAKELHDNGVDDFRIIEKTGSVGGVWSRGGVGEYPGAACDVPSYMYLPLLDETGFIPSKKYVTQPEICSYAETLTKHLNLGSALTFDTEVIELRYEGNGHKTWRIKLRSAREPGREFHMTSQHVVCANGPLSSPRMPEFGGMESFQGESFHTAKWNSDAVLANKKVAVIGTGASAAQVITTIADDVESLHVFQRTPTWCARRDDEPTPPEIRKQFLAGGYSGRLRFVDWKGEYPPIPPEELLIDVDALHDDEQNEELCQQIRMLINSDVEDPETAKLLTPDYPFFCKRVLFLDDYYSTFNKPNVTLVHDEGGVVSIDETGLTIARGEHFEFDVIVYATGFDSGFIPFPIYGAKGRSLAEKFGANERNNFQMTRPESLWGIHVDDMPNFYMMVGPQSINPVTNVTLLCEEQAKHIGQLIGEMVRKKLNEVEPSRKAVDDWTSLCEGSIEGKVWLKCNNWYLKTTKTDQAAGRERSSGMWMDTYEEYLQYLLGEKGGKREELLEYK